MTIVGEDGINLSGGQKQLIAFVRAIYNPFKILILDEMTSSMDRTMEAHINRILKTISKYRIVIFVTHKLHTVKNMSDRIYIVEDGKATVKGSHTELMRTQNFYSEYWN